MAHIEGIRIFSAREFSKKFFEKYSKKCRKVMGFGETGSASAKGLERKGNEAGWGRRLEPSNV